MELSRPVKQNLSRDVKGPSPHSVGIIGRSPYKIRPDYLIIERKRREEERERADAIAEEHFKTDLKTAWVLATEKKILNNTIQHRMDSLLQQHEYSLEERRERLRTLIAVEEEEYLSEIASQQETVLEKQAKMRERAKSLKDRRERERLAYVEEKLDKRWRNQCEELRGIQSKLNHEDISRQRAEQLRLKMETQKRMDEEETLYAKLWKDDHLVKSKREEMEASLQIERNKEVLDLLNVQTAAREKEREDMRLLRGKEAELLKEEAALRAIEEVKEREEKKKRQDMTKDCLDYSLKIKMKRRAKEVQEELALDMKILEKMLSDTTNESMENLQRKNRMKDEIKIYKQYLEDQATEEKEREKELDAIITAEVKRQWSKRVEQWNKEKEARKKLMQEVIDTRKIQLEERCTEEARLKVEAELEKNKLIREFEKHKILEKREMEEKKKAALSYQDDLVNQMRYMGLTRQLERQRLEEEKAMQKDAEDLYKKRVQDAINRSHPDAKLELLNHAL